MNYIIILIILLYGICVGSFLNVCIFRIPNKENIVSKRSHCQHCGNVLKWYELIPVFSYILQKGKCRNCKKKLSKQYPMIELLNGAAWVFIYLRFGFTYECLLFCLCTSVLIVISTIDFKTFEIPAGCNFAILILGIARLAGDLAHWSTYVIGFFTVSTFFYLIYIATKGRGIGGGDIKLMAAAGLLLGWQQILLAMVLGCILGAVIHTALMKLQKKDRVLAFGPYLSMGIFITILFGDFIINWYVRFIL